MGCLAAGSSIRTCMTSTRRCTALQTLQKNLCNSHLSCLENRLLIDQYKNGPGDPPDHVNGQAMRLHHQLNIASLTQRLSMLKLTICCERYVQISGLRVGKKA